MRSLISIVVFGLLVMGCNHHDRTKAEVYYIYPEPIECEDPECEEVEDGEEHHHHGHHDHGDDDD